MEFVSHLFNAEGFDNTEPLLIMPVGDIQWAGDPKEVALKMLKRHVQWGADHNAYFLGMGDYIDAFSPSNRQKVRSAALYDTAMKVLDQKAEELVEQVYEALAPSKGRWLGMLEGHHFHEFRDGTTTDQLLADKLGARFLGTSAYVRLRFKTSNNQAGDVLIWCHHGVGTGQTAASVLNRLGRISQGFEADIYLMAHLHRKVAEPIDYTFPVFPEKAGEPKLVHRTRIIACTGSFLKGYTEGSMAGLVPRGSYVEQKMLNPVALGGVVVKVKPRWKHVGTSNIWLPDLGVEQ